jgi:soluble lytic murein transglycosylase-like protein
MDALKILAGAFCLMVAPAPARCDPVDRWELHIAEASARFGVPVVWIERVMRAESGGQVLLAGRPIVSRAGAMGLMQLMPGTWAEMRRRLGLGSDPHAPRDNILAGTLYLRLMYDRFGYPGLFGAYNAGPARYAASLAGGRALSLETRQYLVSLSGAGGNWGTRLRAAKPTAPMQPAPFFSLRTDGEGTAGARETSFFVTLRNDARPQASR